MAAVTICSDFGAPKNKVWHCFPIYLPWSNGTRCHDLSFLNVQFEANIFTLLSPAIRVVSSAYLRLLIFLPAILITACVSSSPAFLMMSSAYKLNNQGYDYGVSQSQTQLKWISSSSSNIQPWHTPFPIWNQPVVPCPVLIVVSWPAYRFLKRQVRWSGIPISFRIFHSLL